MKWYHIALGIGIPAVGVVLVYFLLKPEAPSLDEVERELRELDRECREIGDRQPTPEEQEVIDSKHAALLEKFKRTAEAGEGPLEMLARLIHMVFPFISEGEILWVLRFAIASAAGYIIWRLWKRYRPPPPSYRCEVTNCGREFPTKAALDEHTRTEHAPTTDMEAIREAQAYFYQLPEWVMSSVATESGLYDRVHADWRTWEVAAIVALAVAATVLIAYVAAAAWALAVLRWVIGLLFVPVPIAARV